MYTNVRKFNSLFRNSSAQVALQLSLHPCTIIAYPSDGLHPVTLVVRLSFCDVDTNFTRLLSNGSRYTPRQRTKSKSKNKNGKKSHLGFVCMYLPLTINGIKLMDEYI